MKQISIYTDGSCLNNPGKGGWGCILFYGEHKKIIHGHDPMTTNNKMELKAVIEGLKALKQKSIVQIYTDSKYVQNGMQSWIHSWKKNNWRTSAKKEVMNKDLWMELDSLNSIHQITFNWVKAHSDNSINNEVDVIANSAAKQLI